MGHRRTVTGEDLTRRDASTEDLEVIGHRSARNVEIASGARTRNNEGVK
jgi:hypothetical protein